MAEQKMETKKQIQVWKDFIEEYYYDVLLENIRKGNNVLVISFKKLARFEPQLADLLLEEPEEIMKAGELAIKDLDINKKAEVYIRIKNLPPSSKVKIREIRTKHLKKFITIEGTISVISSVEPMIVTIRFECPNCGNCITVIQLSKHLVQPQKCSCGRKGKFKTLHSDYKDTQRIIAEEPIETLEGNEQPRQLNIILTDDLTDPGIDKKNIPGSKVMINGIVEERPKSMKQGESTERNYLLIANYIEPLETEYEDIIITEEDKEKILELSQRKDLFTVFVDSFAPDIYGYSEIKEAAILSIFGGVKKIREGKIFRRGESNVLLIGDPGCGKSKLLKYAVVISPKGRYISCGGASAAGITASVEKDEFVGGFHLRAGAMVLANNGTLATDELDKLKDEERAKLHEALSENTITIDKASIHATLKAETTVIAAANPKLGRFDSFSDFSEQINLPPALINRFDLIYTMQDLPEEKNDKNIIRRIIDVHKQNEKIEPEITPIFFKKYIAYAKQYIKPKLTKEAENVIEDFFVSVRKAKAGSERKAIPITPRQGESLIRLGECVAKARLSKKIESQDINKAKKILMSSLRDVALDPETGKLDIDMIEIGSSTSKRDKFHLVLDTIRELQDKVGKTVPIQDVISAVQEKENIEEVKIEELLQKLKNNGEIFEPRVGFVHLL